ncbi:MAG: adenylate/guanylate cyclase domain-containing protein [Myxococcota bacterium]|nr:adenylate/guanylate cyclase domain-containing protein [Myxococcota bacterium]
MAKLVVQYVDRPTQEHKLGAFNTLGRNPQQSIQILDRVVSKEHAIITLAEGAYWVQDIGSRNGTFVNDTQIPSRYQLKNGDVIRLGDTKISFEQEDFASNTLLGRRRMTSQLHQRVRLAQEDQQELNAIQTRLNVNHLPGFRHEREIQDQQTLRDDYEKLRAIFELHEAFGGVHQLESMLDKLLGKIFELVNAARGVILLLNEEGDFEAQAFRHVRGGSPEDFHISQTILREVQSTESAILCADARLDSRFEESHSIVMQGIRSIICVPLMYEKEFLGAIYLDTPYATGIFTVKDIQLLMVLATSAGSRVMNARLTQRAEDEAVARTQLSRLLSPNLVEEVVQGRITVEQGGQEREVTVLFADIRGFTSMSERIPPQELISTLNEYFEIMVEIVFKYEGTLDKFIGDEIMAVWGAPLGQDDHAQRALQATVEMRSALEQFNRSRERNGLAPLRVGCGLNCGRVSAGYLGSSQTLSYTVLGDVVNVASRLCSHAKADEILISDPVREATLDFFELEAREPVQFKGKSTALPVYQVIGSAGIESQLSTPSEPPQRRRKAQMTVPDKPSL